MHETLISITVGPPKEVTGGLWLPCEYPATEREPFGPSEAATNRYQRCIWGPEGVVDREAWFGGLGSERLPGFEPPTPLPSNNQLPRASHNCAVILLLLFPSLHLARPSPVVRIRIAPNALVLTVARSSSLTVVTPLSACRGSSSGRLHLHPNENEPHYTRQMAEYVP